MLKNYLEEKIHGVEIISRRKSWGIKEALMLFNLPTKYNENSIKSLVEDYLISEGYSLNEEDEKFFCKKGENDINFNITISSSLKKGFIDLIQISSE